MARQRRTKTSDYRLFFFYSGEKEKVRERFEIDENSTVLTAQPQIEEKKRSTVTT